MWKKLLLLGVAVLSGCSVGQPPVVMQIQGLQVGDTLPVDFEKKQFVEINGEEMFISFYTNEKNEFIGFGATFNPRQYDYLVEMYTEKLGTGPHTTKTKTVKNIVGLELQNEISEWVTTDGVLQVHKYGVNFREGMVLYRSEELEEELTSERNHSKDLSRSKL